MKKLNVGAGREILKGWDNLDNHNRFNANLIYDLRNLPLPIKNDTYDFIKCTNVLEHFIDVVPLINELVRITKPGGEIEVIVPYRDYGWGCMDHKKQFDINSFYDYLNQHDFNLNQSNNVRIKQIKFHSRNLKIWIRFKVWLFTKLLIINKSIIDYTFLKMFSYGLSIRCVYQKLK